MVWYRDRKLRTVALTGLAILASQILQIIFYFLIAALFREATNLTDQVAALISLLPAILATLGGGAFLGRLRPDGLPSSWIISSVITGTIPLILQAMIQAGSWEWLGVPSVWMAAVGTSLLWMIGCFLGRASQRAKPDSALDKAMIRWTGGITAAVILLYGVTWGSMVFSKGYRLAKTVQLAIPPDVEELNPSMMEPGVARSRHFTTVISSGDTRIQDYYIDLMKNQGWTDVTHMFQTWPVREWQFRNEDHQDKVVNYVLAGGHWQDISGKIMVTLILQGQKIEEPLPWEETEWRIHGMILSRPFGEPASRETESGTGQRPADASAEPVPENPEKETSPTLEGNLNVKGDV